MVLKLCKECDKLFFGELTKREKLVRKYLCLVVNEKYPEDICPDCSNEFTREEKLIASKALELKIS